MARVIALYKGLRAAGRELDFNSSCKDYWTSGYWGIGKIVDAIRGLSYLIEEEEADPEIEENRNNFFETGWNTSIFFES